MNSSEIASALKAKYQPPQYALLFEVRNQTGYSRPQQRYADAIVMDLYPSNGLHLSGFEFKTSRQDLMNDLSNPAKHQEIARHCNFWWLVVGDGKIIKEGEIPEKWGLMVPRGDHLIIKKHAPLQYVEVIPNYFVASLLRSALRASPAEKEIEVAVRKAIDLDRKNSKQNIEYQLRDNQKKIERLQGMVDEFEEKSGIKIEAWDAGRSGEAVKFIKEGGLDGLNMRVLSIKKIADQISGMAAEVLGEK